MAKLVRRYTDINAIPKASWVFGSFFIRSGLDIIGMMPLQTDGCEECGCKLGLLQRIPQHILDDLKPQETVENIIVCADCGSVKPSTVDYRIAHKSFLKLPRVSQVIRQKSKVDGTTRIVGIDIEVDNK